MNKKLVIVGVVATVGLAGLGTAAHATTQSSGSGNLVDALVKKFNLDKSEVEKVFDEQHQARQAERDQRVKDDLAQFVKDGKLTQDQADKLLAKRAELEKNRPTKQGQMTETERQAHQQQMQQKRTELNQWLKDNGIDQQYARYLMGGHKGGQGVGEHTHSHKSATTNQ